jgi:hypothetical protein
LVVLGSAPAPGRCFLRLAENPDAPKWFKGSCQYRPRSAGREGAASHARGGRAPQFSRVVHGEVALRKHQVHDGVSISTVQLSSISTWFDIIYRFFSFNETFPSTAPSFFTL